MLITPDIDYIALLKPLGVTGVLGFLLYLIIGKGIPWLKTELAENKSQLLNEIAEARRERDEQRNLRTREFKQLMSMVRRQDKVHTKGFEKITSAINEMRGQQVAGRR
jgi:hypothetical protein